MESGILELYVLGDVTPDEKIQVEEMAAKHPEVKAELDEIERSLEAYAEENEIEPPAELRSRIMGSMLTNLADDRIFTDKKREPKTSHIEHGTFDEPVAEVKDNVIALPTARVNSFYKYAFAACLALLLASTIALVNMYNRLQRSNNELTALQQDKQHFANQVNLMDEQLQVYRDGSIKFLKLQGTPHAPAAGLTVAFSAAKKKVWIDMTSAKMPVNDKEHQYQLWALVGGKPVDLGVFDANASDSTGMHEMKSIASADAFAVTLEPRGGSVSPTMDQMMVIGKF